MIPRLTRRALRGVVLHALPRARALESHGVVRHSWGRDCLGGIHFRELWWCRDGGFKMGGNRRHVPNPQIDTGLYFGDLIRQGRRNTPGTCAWCRAEARGPTGRKRTWHDDCLYAFRLLRGQYATAWLYRDFYAEPLPPCGCGQPPNDGMGRDNLRTASELDHRVAIGVAARTSASAYVRAFLPGNLQWLCHECHAAKTGRDRQAMNALDPEAHMSKYRQS